MWKVCNYVIDTTEIFMQFINQLQISLKVEKDKRLMMPVN